MAEKDKQLADEELDAIFASARKAAQGEGTPESRAFLNTLASIPARHAQESASRSAGAAGWSLSAWLETWTNPDRLFSARGLVSQGAFAFIMLVSGIAAGFGTVPEPDFFDDYDISASLFGSDDTDYSLDG